MMQVSTLYAHSLERQLVARRSQKTVPNISRPFAADQHQQQQQQQEFPQQMSLHQQEESSVESEETPIEEEAVASAAPEFHRSVSCPAGSASTSIPVGISGNNDFSFSSYNNVLLGTNSCPKRPETDSKEYTDRLCKLPSQCKGGYILGSPRRYPNMNTSARLSQSASNLSSASHYSLVKSSNGAKLQRRGSMDARIPLSGDSFPSSQQVRDQKATKKSKEKEKKEAKKLPSNFMYLGVWTTRQNSEKLLEQVRSGDVLEFNIKFHHHWGIAIVGKNKKPAFETLELVHLTKEKDGRQRAIKQMLTDYWTEGVTARINNSRDVHKQPASASEVISAALKLTSQPYRVWQNSDQMITYCRYGEGVRTKQMSDAARWGTLSKCVGLWLSLTSSRQSSPSSSPGIGRKRTASVNF